MRDLEKIAAPFENREITFEELQELRYRLTGYYVARGYINSGVLLPDQDIVDGVITFLAIEGKLTDIEITGNQRLRTDYLFQRIDPGKENVLNIHTLQEKHIGRDWLGGTIESGEYPIEPSPHLRHGRIGLVGQVLKRGDCMVGRMVVAPGNYIDLMSWGY